MNAPMKINGHYVFQRPSPMGKLSPMCFCIRYAYGLIPDFFSRGNDA